jgi:hypothetical protein
MCARGQVDAKRWFYVIFFFVNHSLRLGTRPDKKRSSCFKTWFGYSLPPEKGYRCSEKSEKGHPKIARNEEQVS